MTPIHEQWSHDLSRCRTAEESLSVIKAAALSLGFIYWAYGARSPLPILKPKQATFSNYPTQWQSRYANQRYVEADPTVLLGASSDAPILWSDSLFSQTPDLWGEANSFGLRYGWAQSSRDTSNTIGLLSLSRDFEPITEVELREKERSMIWLSQICHAAMGQFLRKSMTPQAEVRLTSREVNVLQWSADGKDSCEVAEILGITKRTVAFHIRNVCDKFGSSNKTSAVLIAARLGLI